jgi:hypothetical protein
MEMAASRFSTTDWSEIPATEHAGETGKALWRTKNFGQIRVRMVEYSPGYEADHWCAKGHVLLCLEGELETRLADGRTFTLTPGMSYHVGMAIHRTGAPVVMVPSCSSWIDLVVSAIARPPILSAVLK